MREISPAVHAIIDKPTVVTDEINTLAEIFVSRYFDYKKENIKKQVKVDAKRAYDKAMAAYDYAFYAANPHLGQNHELSMPDFITMREYAVVEYDKPVIEAAARLNLPAPDWTKQRERL